MFLSEGVPGLVSLSNDTSVNVCSTVAFVDQPEVFLILRRADYQPFACFFKN